MAASNSGSNNEASAKIIGAQLQSLLRIPPITKDGQKNVKELAGFTSASEPGGGKAEGKENQRSAITQPPYHPPKMNLTPPKSDPSSVPRDRFGRPFQSLDRDRRGRGGGGGRDFHNGPKRFGTGPWDRDRDTHHPPPPPQQNVIDARERETDSIPNSSQTNASSFQRGRLPQSRLPPPPPPNDHFGQSRKPTGNFEQPPRFSDEPSKVGVQDHVDPLVRQLIKKPECPLDIKDNVDMFYDSNVNNQKLLGILKKHNIQYLIKKSPKFPRAKYYCNCCNYHMDNMYATINHILNERHYTSENLVNIARTISCIPVQHAPEQTAYLTDLLIKTSKLHGMNNTEMRQRMEIVDEVNKAMKSINLDYQASLFGSSLSGFGFRNSNVNININVGTDITTQLNDSMNDQPSSPKTPNVANGPAEFLEISSKLLTLVKNLPNVRGSTVKETFTSKCVSILFEEEKARASCIIHYNNSSAVLAGQLFSEYDKFDERVKPLVLCFRYWARVCDIDDPEKGFLPPHCYTLMVLHFLIRKKKILPNLHMLPRVKTDLLFSTAEEAKRNWVSPNTANESVGELWLDMLRYFATEFSYKTDMITISRDDTSIPKTEKQWNRRLCIEDPILPKSNLCRIVTNNKICDYIIDRIKTTYIYFAIPRKASGPLYDGIFNEATSVENSDIFTNVVESSTPTSLETLQLMVRQIQMGARRGSEVNDLNKADKESEHEVRMTKICWREHLYRYIHFEDAKKLHSILFKREYYYDFEQKNFNDGLLPPLICKSCGNEGHLKGNCPEETVPPFLPVELPSQHSLARLNKTVHAVFEKEALDRHDVNIRTQIVDEVRAILLPFFPCVCLTLFGSTFNGFGMHSSDVDICLTFTDIIVPPDQRGIKLIDVNNVLEKIVTALKASGKMTEILSIPSAKVPIVKFRHIASKLEGDISLYNRLSIYNTELLRLYVDIDSRVSRLGLFLKRLVKLCDVGDASKGSLSSYSYILMLIHFLQNHTVPVLPVLQELHVPGSQSYVDYHCDNHHVKYSKDLNRILQFWNGTRKNTESVSELWLAFLNYYIEKFDFEKNVITISQLAPLTRAAKSWFTDAIAIEDPFDKTHNLGLGLTRRMSVHIIRTLQKFRSFYHRSTDHIRNENYIVDYYLDSRNVRDGNPPIDRQCRLCNRIGHFARSCTYVNKPEDGNNKRFEDEESQVTPFDNFEDVRTEVNAVTNGPKESKILNKNIDPARREEPVGKINSIQNSPVKAPWGLGPIIARDETGRDAMLNNLSNGNTLVNADPALTQQLPSQDVNKISNVINKSLGLEPVKPVIEPSRDADGNNQSVIFFGDIEPGNANPEGEQIQAMLQKNEGVTFAFGLGHQVTLSGNSFENTPPQDTPSTTLGGNATSQPPPGFCPSATMYLPNGLPVHSMPMVSMHQGLRPMLQNPAISQQFGMAHVGLQLPAQQNQQPQTHPWPTPIGMPVRFQPMVPVGTVPFDVRQQANGMRDSPNISPPVPVGTAPPPGFAPLPTPTNNSSLAQQQQQQPVEMIRNYPQNFSGLAPMTMYSVAPVGVGFPGSAYTSTATSETNENKEPVIAYRQVVGAPAVPSPPHVAMHYEGVLMTGRPNSNPNLVHHHINSQMPPFHQQQRPQHPVSVPLVLPNGQPENGEALAKATTASAEHVYGTDFGNASIAIVPGNSSVPTYAHGLSLSQAHHGPVVSALQMQHSQHHPLQMQNAHFHQVRPQFMPIGAFPPGSQYNYPAMHVHQQHPQMQQQLAMQHTSEQLIQVPGGEQVTHSVPVEAKQAK